jgi:hypothetical protein
LSVVCASAPKTTDNRPLTTGNNHEQRPKNKKAGQFARPFHQPFNETLRPRVAEREVASAISTEARPFARSSVVGSEVGTQLKDLDQRLVLLIHHLKELPGIKKGTLRPFVAAFRRRFELAGNLYHTAGRFRDLRHKLPVNFA